MNNGLLNYSSLNKFIPWKSALDLNKLYTGEFLTPIEINRRAKRYIAEIEPFFINQSGQRFHARPFVEANNFISRASKKRVPVC